ncbi:MAG: HupE/UreJ family protein [Rudaea sp.]|uniref:HupE/UreJ family protein n=1 Tax=Rudaea sp. TaxID=2136325 RepID=UPI0039E60855
MRKSKPSMPPSSTAKIKKRPRLAALLAALALAAVSVPAFAHPGHAAHGGLLAGFAHPLLGADHLLAMFAVGVWAAQLGGRALWAVPPAFVSVMALGAAAAISGHAGFASTTIESGIAASLLALGLLVLCAQRLPLAAAIALVGAFAWFHGAAHGGELPDTADPLRYAIGFLAATALLHGAGIVFGTLAQRHAPRLGRAGGAATAIAGVAVLTGAI